jgi:hypothetical protein
VFAVPEAFYPWGVIASSTHSCNFAIEVAYRSKQTN